MSKPLPPLLDIQRASAEEDITRYVDPQDEMLWCDWVYLMKGKKAQKRVLAVSRYRLFIYKKGGFGKKVSPEKNFHLLQLFGINEASGVVCWLVIGF